MVSGDIVAFEDGIDVDDGVSTDCIIADNTRGGIVITGGCTELIIGVEDGNDDDDADTLDQAEGVDCSSSESGVASLDTT